MTPPAIVAFWCEGDIPAGVADSEGGGGMTDTTTPAPAVVGKLSTLDRFLPLWIGLAMAAGLLLGRLVPDLDNSLDKVKVDTVSLPITSATAMKPRPTTMFSNHALAYAVDRCAPPMPARQPPKVTATIRIVCTL